MAANRQYEGAVVRALRASRRLSQKEFCQDVFKDKSANAVKALSKIENGIQAISPDQIEKIEKIFGVTFADEAAKMRRSERTTPLALLPDSEYFDYLSRFYDKAVAAAQTSTRRGSTRVVPAEVWFFHPLESLPVLKSDKVRELWVRNLERGIDKHFVWPLPITTSGDLAMYHDLAVALVDRLRGDKDGSVMKTSGRINFWACDDIDGATNPKMVARYRKYQESLTERAVPIVYNPVLKLGSSPEFQGILSLDSVILNLPTNPELPRYAAEFLDDVGSTPEGNASSGWLFKAVRSRTRLIEMVRRLKELLEAKQNE